MSIICPYILPTDIKVYDTNNNLINNKINKTSQSPENYEYIKYFYKIIFHLYTVMNIMNPYINLYRYF